MNLHNPNCDGDQCTLSIGQVRVLPIGGGDGNAILCKACYSHEMKFRRERNRELKRQNTGSSFDLPKWEDLKIYAP